jgi:drug/metabolite transporter (DMT)-like permease
MVKEIQTHYNYTIPLLLLSTYYLFFFIFSVIVHRKRIKKPKIKYILIAVLDSQANYLSVYSFSIIHFTYPFLINISSFFWSVIFTLLFLRNYRYKIMHFIGVIIVLAGACVSLYGSISGINQEESLFDNIKGLVICLVAAILYAA